VKRINEAEFEERKKFNCFFSIFLITKSHCPSDKSRMKVNIDFWWGDTDRREQNYLEKSPS
jgi:hypothetical protein